MPIKRHDKYIQQTKDDLCYHKYIDNPIIYYPFNSIWSINLLLTIPIWFALSNVAQSQEWPFSPTCVQLVIPVSSLHRSTRTFYINGRQYVITIIYYTTEILINQLRTSSQGKYLWMYSVHDMCRQLSLWTSEHFKSFISTKIDTTIC